MSAVDKIVHSDRLVERFRKYARREGPWGSLVLCPGLCNLVFYPCETHLQPLHSGKDLESQSLLFAAILLICNIYISPQSCFKKLYKLLLGKNLCSKKIGPVQSRCAGLGVERGFTGRRDVSDKEMILKELVSRSSLSRLPMHILIQ